MTPLQKIRLKKKLTLQQVAERIGVDQTTIMRIEKGESWPRTKETLDKIVAFYEGKVKEMQVLYPERFKE